MIMQDRSIPGLQLSLITPRGLAHRSYGYSDAKKQKKIEKASLFQAGALIRPFTAYLALKNLQKGQVPQNRLKTRSEQLVTTSQSSDFSQLRLTKSTNINTPINLHHLLSMTSGLPVSKMRAIPKGMAKQGQTNQDFLLHIANEPGQEIRMAPQGYAYVGELIEAATAKNFSLLAKEELQKMGISRQICVQIKHCALPQQLSEGLTSVKATYFPMPKLDITFPAAASLFTSSHAYSQLLSWLWQQSHPRMNNSTAQLLFQPQFRYAPQLGGTGYGFFISRPLWYTPPQKQPTQAYNESLVFSIESSLPGYSSLAFISSQGYGAVLLANKDDLFGLRNIQRRIYELYQILSPEAQFKDRFTFPSATKEKEDLQGSFRPMTSLPESYAWLRFLNELQLRRTSQAIELSSVFEKEIVVRLYPIPSINKEDNSDVYMARGLAQIDGWRILLRRDQKGNITGIDMDLGRYVHVPKIFSAWSILISLGIVFGSPMFIIMFYFILRKRQP